jgi:hypothetical protein
MVDIDNCSYFGMVLKPTYKPEQDNLLILCQGERSPVSARFQNVS